MSDRTERTARASFALGNASIAVFGMPGSYLFKTFGQESFREHARLLESLRLTEAAIPYVGRFNAEVISYANMPLTFSYGETKVRTGCSADGVLLLPGETALIVTGDCPTLVAYDAESGNVAAIHAGRDSVIDRTRIQTSISSRAHEGVLTSLFAATGWNPAHTELFLCAGIHPLHFSHSFSHPEYGKENEKLVQTLIEEYGSDAIQGPADNGCINLCAILKEQAKALGVPEEHISHDELDTYTDPNLWSNRNEEKRVGRNVVVVTNTT